MLRSNRAIHLGKRDPKFVDHPIRVEAEMRCRLKLGDEGVLDQFRTKTSPGWFPYGRPALFHPSQQEAITTICHSCFDIHPSGRARERAPYFTALVQSSFRTMARGSAAAGATSISALRISICGAAAVMKGFDASPQDCRQLGLGPIGLQPAHHGRGRGLVIDFRWLCGHPRCFERLRDFAKLSPVRSPGCF